MATVTNFEDLEIWQDARELSKFVYRATKSTKFIDDMELRKDMRGNSVRAMNNIAEGFERSTNKQFVQYLETGRSTVGELRSQFYVCLDQEYLPKPQFEEGRAKCISLARRISALITYLEKDADRARALRGIPSKR